MLRSSIIAAALLLLSTGVAGAQSSSLPSVLPSTAPPSGGSVPSAATPAAPTPAPATAPSPPMPTPPAAVTVTMSDGTVVPVFGSDLFSGAFASARPGALPSYAVQPGDQIAVHIYGAVNSDAVSTVDPYGRLFLQGVGPVSVGSMTPSAMQTAVTQAVRNVYTNAVGIYVNVVNGGTLGVYVTGDVAKSGRYVGSPGDSVLYFLDQAGGIDPLRGSFRDISIRRNGQIVAHYDLYEFMLKGAISPFKFEDGDIVFVGQRGAIVAATGSVRNAYAFEAPAGSKNLSGRELVALSIPAGVATSATVNQSANGVRGASYYTMAQLPGVTLADGTTVAIRSEIFTETIGVTAQGNIRGQSAFVMPRGALLSQVLAQVPLDGTDIVRDAIHILRPSVALAQKDALNRALDTLQRAVITEPVYGSDTASAKSADVSAVQQYITEARQIQPDGSIAVFTDGRLNDLTLENGDIIVMPSRTDVVIVAGEVLSPGAFSYGSSLSALDYINHAGGFGDNANRKRVVFRRQDGSALVADAKSRPRAGDQITVVPNFGAGRSIGFLKDITQIIFQIATTAAVAINVSKN